MDRTGKGSRKAVARALGFVPALAALAIGFGLTGAGHGIYTPLFFSLLLVFLYPLIFVRAFAAAPGSPHLEVGTLAVAAALDAALVGALFSEQDYFLRSWRINGGLTVAWLALWAGWQVLVLAMLLRLGWAKTTGPGA